MEGSSVDSLEELEHLLRRHRQVLEVPGDLVDLVALDRTEVQETENQVETERQVEQVAVVAVGRMEIARSHCHVLQCRRSDRQESPHVHTVNRLAHLDRETDRPHAIDRSVVHIVPAVSKHLLLHRELEVRTVVEC